MQPDIRRLGGINLYFPFLDQKNGKIASLRQELDWIIAYTLLVDRILFPPRSLFSGKFSLQNLADLASISILKHLVDDGTFITTTTNRNTRDISDLFECYSHLHNIGKFPLSDFSIYSRNEEFQKKLASEYAVEKIKNIEEIDSFSKDRMIFIASKNQGHTDFTANINETISPENIDLKNKIMEILSSSYFYAGAKGNSAIMPPVENEQSHDFYEFFYSKQMLYYFASEFKRAIGGPIHSVKYNKLCEARSNLAIFREQYFSASLKHRLFFNNINNLLSKKYPIARIRAPILALQATAATSIGLALSPILGAAAFGVAAAGKFAWEAVSKGYKINDRFSESMRKTLVKAKILSPYTKDILELLESYQKSINSTFKK